MSTRPRRRTKSANPLPKTAEDSRELPGSVCVQYVRCGKANCHCASGDRADLHGPYHYRFWRAGGRLRKAYVPAARVSATRAACERRRERERNARQDREAFRALLTTFRTHSREIETLLGIRDNS